MALQKTERVRLLSSVLHEFKTDTRWSNDQLNLVLSEFGLEEVYAEDPDYWGSVGQSLRKISNEALVDLIKLLPDLDLMATEADADVPDLWEPELIRAFLSHSSKHREQVSEISRGLHEWNIQGFVAHQSMRVSVKWQGQIEAALRSCDIFVGFIHPEFNLSQWTNQEVGWAYGRSLPIYFVRLGADPKGFPANIQWPSGVSKSPTEIATSIASLINGHPKYSHCMVGSLIEDLAVAHVPTTMLRTLPRRS